ncbi:MAG: RHS repeat protein, partial [Hymenobacter sp.]
DAAGRVVAEEGFDGLRRTYDRDAAGRVITVHRPAGRTTRYAYHADGQVSSTTHNDEAPITYEYDGAGALVAAHTAATSVRFERDALGHVTREQQGIHTVDYEYDARGQRTYLHSSLGADFSWQHDVMGNLMAVQAGGHWQARLQHDARGLEVQRQLSGGVQQSWQYDTLGRPTRQQVQARGGARQRTYYWQGTDQLTAIDDSLAGTTHYTYDALGALTGARYPDDQEELRLADAVGNLFRTPALNDRTYNAGGQLRTANGTHYHYDAEGNLLRKTAATGQQWQYSWDGAGQLVRVRLPNGYQVTFTYDALGRRVAKRYRGRVSRWVWASDVPLHEWQELERGAETGSIQDLSTWLFEENSFVPTAKLTKQGAYSVVADHLGTPLALYDEQGQPAWTMTLDSYGAVRHGQGKPQDCPFRYQGQYEDVETGLYYNRFRYYDPEVGGYISQDPIGLNGGTHEYAYVNSPTTYCDPLGLYPWSYTNMPKLDGFQLHHIVPRSLGNHEVFKLAQFNVDNISNTIYLPKAREYHPTRSIHNGWNRYHKAYNERMLGNMDDLLEYGKAEGWTQKEFEQGLKELIAGERQELRQGKVKLHPCG